MFPSFVGTDYAFATSTGTAALHPSLVALDIGPGNEVIVPDTTWVSCVNLVEWIGADPVFVDVDPSDLTIDTEEESLRDEVREKIPREPRGSQSQVVTATRFSCGCSRRQGRRTRWSSASR
ncbi:MAG: aminotransferase class I/II-fold pyridoxal phosphate-dependent enzyme, partial [Halobaculum sp.]